MSPFYEKLKKKQKPTTTIIIGRKSVLRERGKEGRYRAQSSMRKFWGDRNVSVSLL